MDKFAEHFLSPMWHFFESTPILGWVAFLVILCLWILKAVAETSGHLDVWYSKLLKPIAASFKFRWLVREAKKYDIRGHVNTALSEIRGELPAGWITEIDIQWVDKETKEEFFRDNEPVLRVRPFEQQSRNLVNVTYRFLKSSFFPKVQKIIPAAQREAAILCVCARIVRNWDADANGAFLQHIFEPAVADRNKVLQYYHRFSDLDEVGFFSGVYLREMERAAEGARATHLRVSIGNELNDALTHLEQFLEQYKTGEQIQEDLWSRIGVASRYALLLVANPSKVTNTNGAEQYLGRATRNFGRNVDRMYVLGTAAEKRFASEVIATIKHNTGYHLVDTFHLYRDYRGQAGGVAALFSRS